MASPVSFWQRVGSMLRGGGAAHVSGNGNGAYAPRSAAVVDVADSAQSGPGGAVRPLSRWGRREPSLAQMRDGYQRVLDVMDAMEEHFRQQDERAKQLNQSVTNMAGVLEQLAAAQHGQQEHVRVIAENVTAAGRHAAVMSESLSQMPKSLAMQAETMRSMLKQAEISQEADTQLMHSLQQLGRAVDGLSASSGAQVQTLSRLDAAQQEQRASLTALVHEQGRRFVFITVIAALLGVAALAALATVVVLLFGR